MSDNYYISDYGVQTIHIGDGSTLISTVSPTDNSGLFGISFSNTIGSVGELHPEVEGKKVDEIGSFMQILTSNPASIQVLINSLRLVKYLLIESKEG